MSRGRYLHREGKGDLLEKEELRGMVEGIPFVGFPVKRMENLIFL